MVHCGPGAFPPSRGGGARPRGGARALNWRGGGSASPPPAPPPVVGPWPWHFVSETPFPAQRALSSEWTHDGAHSTPRGISRFTAAHPLAFLAPRRPRSGPAAAPQGAGMSRGPAAFCSGHHCPAAGRHAGGAEGQRPPSWPARGLCPTHAQDGVWHPPTTPPGEVLPRSESLPALTLMWLFVTREKGTLAGPLLHLLPAGPSCAGREAQSPHGASGGLCCAILPSGPAFPPGRSQIRCKVNGTRARALLGWQVGGRGLSRRGRRQQSLSPTVPRFRGVGVLNSAPESSCAAPSPPPAFPRQTAAPTGACTPALTAACPWGQGPAASRPPSAGRSQQGAPRCPC